MYSSLECPREIVVIINNQSLVDKVQNSMGEAWTPSCGKEAAESVRRKYQEEWRYSEEISAQYKGDSLHVKWFGAEDVTKSTIIISFPGEENRHGGIMRRIHKVGMR